MFRADFFKFNKVLSFVVSQISQGKNNSTSWGFIALCMNFGLQPLSTKSCFTPLFFLDHPCFKAISKDFNTLKASSLSSCLVKCSTKTPKKRVQGPQGFCYHIYGSQVTIFYFSDTVDFSARSLTYEMLR